MENYGGMQMRDQSTANEDRFTKSIEKYTASIPSSAYFGIALGAMALSLIAETRGQGKWGNFIAQWVPTWLMIGVYNKVVKLEGHDRSDREGMGEQPGEYTCEFCESKFSLQADLRNHEQHCSARDRLASAGGVAR
jgi:hypothetical protein